MSMLEQAPATSRPDARRKQPSTTNRGAAGQVKLTALVCAIACGVFVAVTWLPTGTDLEFTPDSYEYEAIAENLSAGRGFRNRVGEVAANRSPLYPVVLALLFHEDPRILQSRIAALHRCLAFVIGGSLFLYGRASFGRVGSLCGILTCILISADDELSYSAVQILTELPATAILCLTLLAMRWVSQGPARRELLMAVLQICLFMTRSALVFCGVSYGIYLIYCYSRTKSRASLQRIALFGMPCALCVCVWSLFLWAQTGQIVLLTSTGLSNLAAGLSPEIVAQSYHWAVPRTDRELEEFWTGAPPVPNAVVAASAWQAVRNPLESLQLFAAKFKIAFHRMPLGAFYLGICGAALQLSAHLRESRSATCWRLRALAGQCAYGMAFCICSLALCGYSLTALKVGIVVTTIAIVVCHVSPKGVPYAPREEQNGVAPAVLMIYGGFILMTVVSFGLPRFTRPFLPAMYLSATLCLPLACRLYGREPRTLGCDTHLTRRLSDSE